MSLSNDTTMTMPVMPAYNCGNGYGNNNGWGGDWASWILLFVIFGAFSRGGFGGFGGWGNGNDGCGCCAPATCADLQNGFNNQSVMNKLNGLENGLCSLGYDQLNQMNGINTSILNGFHGVDNAVCQLGYQTQQGINGLSAQMAQCCCETQRQIERGFCDTNYALATNTTAIIQNAHNDTDRVIAKLCDMENSRKDEKIASQQAEIQGLKFAASQASQNAFITANQEAQTAELIRRLGRDCPIPAYVVPNPNCCYGTPVGVMNNGCGCNNCCA